ncbi:Sporulation kinase E [compost metagenome]
MLGKNAYQILKHTDAQGIPYSTEKSPLHSSMNEGIYYHVADEIFRRKSGDVFPVEFITSPIHENGKIVGAVITFKDITVRKRSEEMLLKSEKLSIVGQIAAGVAHEIRNPLTALKGFTQFLQTGAANKQAYYDIMLSELNHIEFIITEMLVLAKPHIIRYQFKELEPILRNVVTLLETQAILNNIQFVIVLDRDIPKVFCEENQLKQMFINLLKNAMESMPNGGQIDIQMHMKDPQHISILIKDQGIGIPSEVLGRVGEPFFTTKEKGTGLGVMISYKIIEDHQGSMNMISQVGEGTVIEIGLPVTRKRSEGENIK